ncbi:MAG: D-glycero-beta-D-manno-heptose-7-phosphate kinase [Candidatus Sumerlaeaceae bacterium]|nr:D-glycero-beta-D-manno-heptose-7-phosphate kinase [Candidatus Sumerlaeaceae bacterium]
MNDPVAMIERLPTVTVLVVGDLILDHYITGTTERVSPEAPVPVVLQQHDRYIAGGAANVVRNIRAAGARAICAGVIGHDAEGQMLRERIAETGADCSGIVPVDDRPTTLKTRIVSQGQQMLRIDREQRAPLDDSAIERIVTACCAPLNSCDAVILSDYGKGVLTPRLIADIVSAARQAGKPVFVDPKGRDFSRYRGATALTPNAREAAEASGLPAGTPEQIQQTASLLLNVTDAQYLVITRGAQGFALCRPGAEPVLGAATAREVFDVTGAGDTFVAFLALAVAAGLPPEAAAHTANAAAGVVVAKQGAATVSPYELQAALIPTPRGRKLRTPSDLAALGEALRAAGRKIVFTNGCFDFIHAGHVAMLQRARALGDVLVLATNTDDVITRLKGAPRPVIPQTLREDLLASIEAVDYVVAFSDETPHRLIRDLRPDVLVKGSNYTPEQIEGREIVEAYGGRVERIEIIGNISTAELLGQRPAS